MELWEQEDWHNRPEKCSQHQRMEQEIQEQEEELEPEQGRMEQIQHPQLDALQWEECGTPEKDSLHKEEAVVNPQPRWEDLGGLHINITA